MEEDPVLYQKLSEVIDEAIQAYIEKRLSEEEYFKKMLDAWNEATEQGSSKVPAELRSDPEAKAFFRLFQDGFEKAAGKERTDIAAIAAETALKAKQIIEEKKIRDWTNNRDVENAMLNDLDDLMYAVKGRYDLPLTSDDLDEIHDGIIRVAKRRETRK
jgi:type I restriction enzyme, R subunit